MKKLRLGDFLLFFLIIFAAIFSIKITSGKKDGAVKIQTPESSYIYSLSEDGIHTVDGLIGKTTFEIKDGKVKIIDSPCPNKTCISQGWGTTIICLPNKIFITVEDSKGEFDAVAK